MNICRYSCEAIRERKKTVLEKEGQLLFQKKIVSMQDGLTVTEGYAVVKVKG